MGFPPGGAGGDKMGKGILTHRAIGMPARPEKRVLDFERFFRIGVSPEYILIRADFPLKDVSPGEFARLIATMFQRNDEECGDGK